MRFEVRIKKKKVADNQRLFSLVIRLGSERHHNINKLQFGGTILLHEFRMSGLRQ